MQPIVFEGADMRSDLVFTASEKVPNRFLLCRMVSVSAGKMHRNGEASSNSINRSLQMVNEPVAVTTPAVALPVLGTIVQV
jgi:hypothetical protein